MNFYVLICVCICMCINKPMAELDKPSIYNSINELVNKYSNKTKHNWLQTKDSLFGIGSRPNPLSILMNFNLDGTSSFNLIDPDKGVYWSDIGKLIIIFRLKLLPEINKKGYYFLLRFIDWTFN